jgi:bacteriorhodopsin
MPRKIAAVPSVADPCRICHLIVSMNNIKDSFLFSYIFLSGLTLITLIEALRTPNVKVRQIMNLETTVSLVASLVYWIMLDKMQKGEIDEGTLNGITQYRYFDWFITTPMLLLVLLMFYNYAEKDPIYLSVYGWIIALDFIMLASGYIGEHYPQHKMHGSMIGFVALIVLLGIIYVHFVKFSSTLGTILFAVFSVVWISYGVVYWIKDVHLKNKLYNALDVIAKVFFGIFMWIYYSNIFVVKG